jgi:hypothetical protein
MGQGCRHSHAATLLQYTLHIIQQAQHEDLWGQAQQAGHHATQGPESMLALTNDSIQLLRAEALQPSHSEPPTHLLSMHAVVCLRQCCECVVEAMCHCQAATLHTQPTEQCVGLNHCLQGIRHTPSSTVSLGCRALQQHTARQQERGSNVHSWVSLPVMRICTLLSSLCCCRPDFATNKAPRHPSEACLAFLNQGQMGVQQTAPPCRRLRAYLYAQACCLGANMACVSQQQASGSLLSQASLAVMTPLLHHSPVHRVS